MNVLQRMVVNLVRDEFGDYPDAKHGHVSDGPAWRCPGPGACDICDAEANWWRERLKELLAPVRASYGKCPHCGAACRTRERRPNGNDTCENGHVYPSAAAV